MEKTNELPIELEFKIIKCMRHPIADAFKKGLEEELEDHFHVMEEGPCYEQNWCQDDEYSFAYEYFKQKKDVGG